MHFVQQAFASGQGEKNIDILYKIWYLFNEAKYYDGKNIQRYDGLCAGTW